MLKVKASPELRATALLFRNADRETKAAIRKESAKWAPTLRTAIQARARTAVDKEIAASAKVTTTARGLKATVGSSGRLSSGEPLRTVARPYEFGTAQPDQMGRYIGRSSKGRGYVVKRRVQRQIPRINPKGRFVYQGLADATPRLVGRYVRAVAETMRR